MRGIFSTSLMASNLAIFLAVLLLFSCHHVAVAESSGNTVCQFPKGMCRCYSELESSLFSTEQNKISLSTAFFPLEDNQPEFVTVHYTFSNTTIEQVWFWSEVTSHFLHPFEVFQFSSLFFGKPEPYYKGSLKITLQAECANLSSTDVKLQLLTQRLQIYAERRTANPALRDGYSAKAYSVDSLKAVFERNSHRTTDIIICTAVFVVVFSVLIIVAVGFALYCTELHIRRKVVNKIKKKPAAVLSLALLSLIANIYIIFLAGCALGFWYQRGEDVLRNLFHNFDERRNLVPLWFALIIDIICLVPWCGCLGVAMYKYYKYMNSPCRTACNCRNENQARTTLCHCEICLPDHDERRGMLCQHCNNCNANYCCYDYVPILSLTVFSPVFCIIAHSPYIAIAYLDDGSHASSIFIYYSLISYCLFAIMWLSFYWCENFVRDIAINKCVITWILLAVAIIILLGLIVTISCYFVLIPINKAISDAPNRVTSIYESGGFLIGSFIAYKVLKFFYGNKEKDTTERIYTLMRERVPLQQQNPQTIERIHTLLQERVPVQQQNPQTIERIYTLLQERVLVQQQNPQTIEHIYSLLQERVPPPTAEREIVEVPGMEGGEENNDQALGQDS